jgi:hypothetical protein
MALFWWQAGIVYFIYTKHMLLHYCTTAFRQLRKHKIFSVINITGLTLGLASSLLILLWVQSELAMDAFHVNGKRLFKVYEREYYDNKTDGNYDTPGPLAAEMKKQFPEVEYAAAMQDENGEAALQYGDKVLKAEGTAAGADLFRMFSYPLVQGNAATALESTSSITLSAKLATAFFGSPSAAMGKTIRFDNRRDFIVSGVFADIPYTSSRRFDYVFNWDAYILDHPGVGKWYNSGPLTFVQLRPDADAAAVDRKLQHIEDAYTNRKPGYRVELGLQPYPEVYLHSHFTNGLVDGGRIEYVHLFSLVAVFILVIACINFMNLATARSMKRAKEIGVRKVSGAARTTLIGQFIGESLLVSSIAMVASLLLVALVLPAFNTLTGKQIALPFHDPGFWVRMVVLTLVTGLLAGSYPALFLSSFQPIRVLKGYFRVSGSSFWLRKGLVVFQFVLSAILIIGTIGVSKQVNFLQKRNLGYDRENLLYIPREGELLKKYELFKTTALQMPGVQMVSFVTNNPINLDQSTVTVDWPGKPAGVVIPFTTPGVDVDFIKTMKLQMAEGRDFSREFATDSSAYIINETAAQKMGYAGHAAGQSITLWGMKGTIIGVVKDFHFRSLHQQIQPLVMRIERHPGYGYLLVRTQPGKTQQALQNLARLCKQLNPAFPFSYRFSDAEYQQLYRSEQIVGRLCMVFTALAVLIACLGLLGLSLFSTEQKAKEISIRKVLGASVASLFALLSAEFLALVVLALLVACPIAWYGMNKWLQGFAYRTTLGWGIFAAAGIFSLLIALLMISFHTLRAALANPVKRLRNE